jgi:transcriptional/translational regulatory protein YebC/TACO1
MTVPVDDESAAKIFKLLEALEDSDEVQTVYANFEASDRALAQA